MNTSTIHNSILLALLLTLTSCEEFIKVDVSKSQITRDLVFSDDNTATSAVLGIYSDMYENPITFSSGTRYSVTALCALSSDELNYFLEDPSFSTFEQNILNTENENILTLWESMYRIIYGTNSIIYGLENSSGITMAVEKRLMGEALFIRAFTYFYLVNLFGEIPLVTTIDYKINRQVHREPTDAVYKRIIEDLLLSQSLIADDYPTDGRVRPNKAVAAALLARAYLFTGDWTNAEAQSSILIDDPAYILEPDLNKVFLSDSKEAIWQLMPAANRRTTNEGDIFILTGPPTSFSTPFALDINLVNAFEPGDPRTEEWIKAVSDGATAYYYPYKYKVTDGPPLLEYSMVFRLAEQYLIRAEARAHLADIPGAISDIDKIRARASLPLIQDVNPTIDQSALLLAIERERRVELFSEWGHRWLDLKRTNRASTVLSGKPEFSLSALLYPIPQAELNKNPDLGDQNIGY